METTKITTGITGLDLVLGGGYLRKKPTLIKGGPGTGKTILTLFFIHEQVKANEAVILVTCDESPEQLLSYMDGFGLSGTEYYNSGKLVILDFRPQLCDQVAGEYELNALMFRIMQAQKSSKAQALVIDSLQDLLLGLTNCNKEMELLKLFGWAREKQLTLLTTIAEFTTVLKTQLLEEYAADCVMRLQQKLHNNLMTRYLRVVKLRGSSYGTNEYPFAIKDSGIFILPVTETRLDTEISKNFISTGIEGLDLMLAGKGYLEGSTVMLSGRSGTAKTLFASVFTNTAIEYGKRVLYVSFEESPNALINNLKSINLDFNRHIKSGKLHINSRRSIEMGLEDHMISIITHAEECGIDTVVLDPISGFLDMGTYLEVKMLLIRFISYMKSKGMTQIFTELLPDSSGEHSSMCLSSITDTWIRLRQVENNGEFNRLINVIKSRGIKTSNQVKEFIIDDQGISIEDPYIGDSQMLFGSEKYARIILDKEKESARLEEISRIEHQIQALDDEYLAQKKIWEAQFQIKKNNLLQAKTEVLNLSKKTTNRRNTNKKMRF